MQDLNLQGTADLTDIFGKLDQFEKRLTDLGDVAIVVKPRVDLGDSLKQLEDFAGKLREAGLTPGSRPVTAPKVTVPSAPSAPNAPVGPSTDDVAKAEALKKRLVEIHNEAAILRSDFIAAGTAANITDEEVAQLQGRVETLQRELRELRPIAEQTFGAASGEVRKLALTTEQLQRTITGATGQMSRLGIASQFKTALDQTQLFQNPQGNVNGIVQLVRGYEQARLSSQSFQKTLQRQNQDVAAAETFVERFANRFNVVPTAIEATTKVLLNNGYTLKQAQETLELYGASALVAAKDVNGAVDALASDVQLGTTVLSNQYGITANQATAWQQYAKSIGIAADALTGEQKAEAYLIQLRKEATQDLREADTILEGVGGNLGEASQQYREAQKQLGEALLPAVTNGAKQLTNFLKAFNELDPAVKDNIANLVVWGTVLAGARLLLSPLFGLLRGGVGLFTKVGELAGKRVAAGAVAELGGAAGAAAPKAAQLGKGLKDISEIGKQPGLWTKISEGAKSVVSPLKNGAAALGRFAVSMAASPATKAGLYGIVLALGYGVGTLIQKIKTLNGLTIGENVQNFSLKAFSGYSQGQVNELRIEEARTEAFNKVLGQQAEALAKAREEKDKDLRSSKLRTLQIERDLAVEQAALGRAKSIGDSGAALTIQDRIKNLTTALGLERQNRATIDANILQQQRLQDLEAKRKPVLEALKKQQVELAKQDTDIRIKAKSDFAQDMATIARDFREQRKKLENQLKNEKDVVIRAEIQTTIDKLDRVQEAALGARAAEEIRSGQEEIASAQRAVEDARVAAMQDGVAKRRAELEGELRDIRDHYAPKIKEALEAAQLTTGKDRKAFQSQAGQLQALQKEAEAAARGAAEQDLQRIEKEEQDKTAARVQAARDALTRVLQVQQEGAELAAQVTEQQRDREVAVAGATNAAKLRLEQQYAPGILALRTRAAQVQEQVDTAGLRRTLAQQLRDARDAGEQRGTLEVAAREEYLGRVRLLEQQTAQKVAQIQLDVQQRVREARLAAQQDVLDRELMGISAATGAELASLTLRLKARRAAAEAAGDAGAVEQLTDALKKVEVLNLDRVTKFKGLVTDAAAGAAELRDRLGDAVPKGAVAAARSEAANPFNSVIKSAEDRISQLKKAFSLINQPTPGQTALFRKSVAEQQAVIQDAQLERNRAVLTAEQAANRELLAGQRDLARGEVESALKVAQADEQRASLRARLLGIDQARLVEVNAELRALEGRSNAEARVKDLKAEQWTLQQNLAQATEEDRQNAEALAGSLIAVAQAQADRLDALALTDVQVVQARQNRLALAAREVLEAQRQLDLAAAQGAGEIKLNGLRAARVEATTRLVQAERSLAALAGEFVDRELTAQQARVRAQARLTGAADDAVAAARIELGLVRQQLDVDRARLANADALGLSDTQRVQLATQIEEGSAGVAEQERAVTRALRDRLVLARDIEQALLGLSDAAAAQGTVLQDAERRADRTTQAVARARQDVANLLDRVNSGETFTADDQRTLTGLTDALRDQQDAVRALGEEYARQVGHIDTLSDAVKGLNDVVRPQEGQPFSVQREAQGLQQLQARRELALRALEQALGSGDAEQIAQALGKVTTQEKAFREQVQRLQKEGYAPYLNLVDTQQRRVLSGVKAAQGVLDGLIERGADNLTMADQLAKDARGSSGDQVPLLAAEAISGAMTTASQNLADQVLSSLGDGGQLVADAIARAFREASITLPTPQTSTPTPGDTVNTTYAIYWQNQELPTPPDYRAMWDQLVPHAERWAKNQARRDPCRP
ncbi:hypothetical protein [Deinococcus soli (ex Cha et al. 2016)]|uniref:hypothetical protein n=1 Tax=Deinococcus soli (ex Cha et al. 2016) TaxID=1309411 RepID=UPI00166DDA04|nr:hypothetical protein [Deinococcus soli (ex Cha et al. 2016)]GGB71230.1 hypothetical protein GCM10008019_29250 [Deinococcus soli (ex Cha et al. 2016)]